MNISYFKVFGCRYFVLNNSKDELDRFNVKSDEAIFLRYSSTNRAYRVFNKRILVMEESIHVIFDEFNNLQSRKLDMFNDAYSLEKEMENMTSKDIPLQEVGRNDQEHDDED